MGKHKHRLTWPEALMDEWDNDNDDTEEEDHDDHD